MGVSFETTARAEALVPDQGYEEVPVAREDGPLAVALFVVSLGKDRFPLFPEVCKGDPTFMCTL